MVDNLWYTHNGFGAKLRQAGALFTLFFDFNAVKVFEELEKCRDKVTHLLFDQ